MIHWHLRMIKKNIQVYVYMSDFVCLKKYQFAIKFCKMLRISFENDDTIIRKRDSQNNVCFGH